MLSELSILHYKVYITLKLALLHSSGLCTDQWTCTV